MEKMKVSVTDTVIIDIKTETDSESCNVNEMNCEAKQNENYGFNNGIRLNKINAIISSTHISH